MQTECSPTLFEFEPVERHKVVAGFDGGIITSDAGGLLLGRLDRGLGLIRRMASCFTDRRDPRLLEHTVETLVGQRVFALALGYEDLNDHDELRHDPLFHVLAGKLEAKRSDCAPVAGKSTLNRLEHRPRREAGKYHKIDYDAPSLEALFVDIFLDGHKRAPKEIVLDLDATDDTIHGEQEGRFFHGYYDSYCYLPLYIFCGRFLLGAKLRPANIDGAAGAVDEVARIVARIRARWPKVRIVLRGDSGFCREELMAWCEAEGVAYLFGLAPNARLKAVLAPEAWEAARLCRTTGKAARLFRDFAYQTETSWSRPRRVVGKAEHLPDGANPRFVVTSLGREKIDARGLYEDLYCARGEMENRIKECQLDLFADRTSSATMQANQLRLWFASMAYVLLRVRLKMNRVFSGSCEAAREELDAGEEDPGLGGLDGRLEVLCQPPVSIEPGERALDDPSAGQELEALHARGTVDDLQRPAADPLQCALELGPGIGAVGEDVAQAGKVAGDGGEHRRRAVAVLDLGAVDHDRDQQAAGVGEDVTLAALDFLSGVEAPDTAAFRGFYALTVDDTGRRAGRAALGLARRDQQLPVDLGPGAVVPPEIKVALHRRAWREVPGQHAPWTAATQ